jgi:hypothetical protein
MYRHRILIKNIQKMQISPKLIIAFLFILPNLALADSVLSDTPSDIAVFNLLTLSDSPRGSKVVLPLASSQLLKDIMLGSGIRPISEVYSDANGFVDGGSVVLSVGGNLEVFAAIDPLFLSLNSPVLLSSSANTASFAQFNSLFISEGSNLSLSSGNASFLARVTNQSPPVLIGNVRTSLGGTLVLSNANGVIVPMSASGAEVSPIITTSVPEPSNLNLLAMGLFCVGLLARRKTKNR